MKKFYKYFALVLFAFFTSKTYSQTDKIKKDIDSIMRQYNAVGLSVAVVKNNKLFYNQSFGLKNIETSTVLNNDDLFRIASISKSFSATAIMQLVDQDKLSLDDDFSNLIGFKVRNPKYPDQVITLKMVLSHTSSINDSEGYFNLDVINPEKNENWAKCYNNYAPGKGYEYCNLNFNMVGAVIEKFTGERFDQYIKHHILDPLNIYGGYCVDSLDKSKFVTLYEYNNETKKFNSSPSAYNPRSIEIKNHKMGYTTPIFSPTGGMKISAQNLAKYMMMHMNYGKCNGKQIIEKKYAKLMQTPVAKKEGYGLALTTVDDLIPNKKMIGHTGSAYGLFSAMFFNPKEKFGIVVITNGCDPGETNEINNFIREAVNSLYQNLILGD